MKDTLTLFSDQVKQKTKTFIAFENYSPQKMQEMKKALKGNSDVKRGKVGKGQRKNNICFYKAEEL